MSSVLIPSQPLLASASSSCPTCPATEVRHQVKRVLFHRQPERQTTERRREKRHPYPYPIRLTPVDLDGRTQSDEPFVAMGKHLSEYGVDFYHHQPIASRRVIASLLCGRGCWTSLLLELRWCRFNQYGWYENGGRFLEVVPEPDGC